MECFGVGIVTEVFVHRKSQTSSKIFLQIDVKAPRKSDSIICRLIYIFEYISFES